MNFLKANKASPGRRVTMDVLSTVRNEYGRKLGSIRRNRVLGGKSSRPAATETLVISHCLTRRTGTKIHLTRRKFKNVPNGKMSPVKKRQLREKDKM